MSTALKVGKIDRTLQRDAKAHRLVAKRFMCEVEGGRKACENAGRCAIGALLFYGGAPLVVLKQLDEATSGMSVADGKVARILKREYGLLPMHAKAIMSINDETVDASNNGVRYEAVMGLVAFITMMQNEGVLFVSADDILRQYEDEDDFELVV